MWDWITSRPQYCLKIGARDLAWAEVHRNWRGRPRYQCVVSALPEGIVRLSPLEQNIISPHELETHIRAIAGSATTQAPGRSSTPGSDHHSAGSGRTTGGVTIAGPSLELR